MEFKKVNKDQFDIIVNGEKVGELIRENKNIIIELNEGIPEYMYSKYTAKIRTWKEAKERTESLYEFNRNVEAMNNKRLTK